MIQSTINEISFNNLQIKHICKPKLKNSYISVSKSGEITLKTSRVSNKYIHELLTQKDLWIRKQLLHVKQNPPFKMNLEDEVLLFGEVYSVDIDEAKELREYLAKVKIPNERNILKCYDIFYKSYANKYLIPRVEYFSNIMNLNYSEIKFRKMKSRWGSCSSKGVITLNTQLIKIDKELIDYIIVHELAHLTHMNHSKKFHNLVESYISNHKELNQRLKAIYLL
ncbi:SprT family zinc-dependent metalloprotease [Sulfurimonas sp.]|uniref:M48 family metallopeptidase n=1 Tax=Sulfurimonas sp. TaxID=2022749 RepID=UPI002613AB18|nr:SprT family zinc-dependent metalloprotease [Sulfurimonas sp.]MCW8895159.1 M48 family metallopeptidase [Sulfurimonas sp.]